MTYRTNRRNLITFYKSSKAALRAAAWSQIKPVNAILRECAKSAQVRTIHGHAY